jgi:hypothetical protein
MHYTHTHSWLLYVALTLFRDLVSTAMYEAYCPRRWRHDYMWAQRRDVRFHVLTAASMKIMAFCDILLPSVIHRYTLWTFQLVQWNPD